MSHDDFLYLTLEAERLDLFSVGKYKLDTLALQKNKGS